MGTTEVMTNNQIVKKYIIENEKVLDAFDKLTKGSSKWKDDLWGELMIIFMEMDNDKLNDLLSQKGEESIRAYFIRITQLQLHSSSSPFYYKYRHKSSKTVYPETSEYMTHLVERSNDIHPPEGLDEHELMKYDTLIDDVNTEYEILKENLSWYQQTLWELFLSHGGDRGTPQIISKETGIPVWSVQRDIREVREYLKNQISYKLNGRIQ